MVAPRRALDPDSIVPWLTAVLNRRQTAGVVAGVGDDDCGVIRLGKTLAVVSVDFVNATPIAEQLRLGSEQAIGRLAVAGTLADLLGSGAVPRALMVGVTVPHGYPEVLFKQIMLGARLEAKRHSVPIIAGDTKLGRARAVLTCGLGTARSEAQLFLANRAMPGDEIYTSGHLGTCAAATFLAARTREKRRIPRWVKEAILVPRLPFERSRRLSELRIANGGIDVSDGLAADLRRMCMASRVGAVLDADLIPVHPRVPAVAMLAGVPSWTFSLASGGDFQFLVTVPQKDSRLVKRLGLTRIGTITAARRLVLTHDAGRVRIGLPTVGHKDRRGQTFAQEVRRLISEAARG